MISDHNDNRVIVPFVFVHINKTGGTSMERTFRNCAVHKNDSRLNFDTDKIDFGAGMEATNAAYTKIEDYSTGFNERGTLALMAKDYYDWQKSDPDAHKDMVRRANEQGIGGFIWYVTRHVEPTDTIGTKYDPLAVGKDNEWRSDFAIQYLRKEGIIVTPTK